MAPRIADPAARTALIEAAARLLAGGGPAALSARRLAAEVGSSTMAIYTQFGSMSELHGAVRQEGFARLAAALPAAGEPDPVAALAHGCRAYLDSALAEPELYHAMFDHRPPSGDDAGAALFDALRRLVERCMTAGRFPATDRDSADLHAGQVWAAVHGVCVLALAGTVPAATADHLLTDLLLRLAVGYGDEAELAARSIVVTG